MLDIILFSIITGVIIAIILFLEASSNDDNIEITDYFKHFAISSIIIFIAFFIFTSINNKSILSEPVDVMLLE
jgi:uncharacterized integral membrane protein